MAVFEVIYRSSNGEKHITLDSIENRKDFATLKYNIYCSTAGCNCRMEYVPRGVKVAYFKKWRGNEYQHSLDCPHYVDTETGKRPRKRLGIHSSSLRSDHKKSILKDMYKKYIETEEERKIRNERNRMNRRNRPNKRIKKDRTHIDEIVSRPSTNNQGESLQNGDRNPLVPRSYTILHIGKNQLNKTVAVIDRILEVENDFENPNEKRSIVTLTNQNNTLTFKIILEQVFFAQSPLNVDSLLDEVKQRAMRGEAMTLSALGQIIERSDELCMMVFDEGGLNINGKSILVYLSSVR